MPGKMLIQIEGSATEELKMFIAGLDYTNFKDCVRCFLCDAKCKTAHGLWTHLKKHGAQQDIINPLNAIMCALRKQIVDEDEEFTVSKKKPRCKHSAAKMAEMALPKPAHRGPLRD